MSLYNRIFHIIIWLLQTDVASHNICPTWKGPQHVFSTFHDDPSCYVYIGGKVNWNIANDICSENGWSQVKIESEEVQTWIQQILVSNGHICCWIGLSDTEKEGDFRWIDGSVPMFKTVTTSFIFHYLMDCVGVCQEIGRPTYVWKEMLCSIGWYFVCQINSAALTTTSIATSTIPEQKPPSRRQFSLYSQVKDDKGTKLTSEPYFSTKCHRRSICLRECDRNPYCVVFNFNQRSYICNGYSSDALEDRRLHEEGWEIWMKRK